MAIALRAAGAWASGAGTPQSPAIPAGTTTGDIMVVYLGAKPFGVTFTFPAGWTELTACEGTNGTVANGTDVGSVSWSAAYREWQSGDAAPAVTIGGGVNVCLYVMLSFSKTAAAWETPVGCKGSDTTSGTGFSLAMDANPGITAGDMLASFATLPGNNSTFGSPVITATSATIGAATEAPATEGSTATGLDLESSSCWAECTAGTASANPTVAWTLSVAQTGGGCLVRLREAAAAAAKIPPYLAQGRFSNG